MTVIEIGGLSKSFANRGGTDRLTVLRDIDLSVGDTQFVCVLGRSGCGKSTLLNLISGLDPTYEGSISFDREVLRAGRPSPVRIGYVFQDPRLLPWQTVRENLSFALRRSRVPVAERAARAQEWIERVGLGDFADSYPHELSGGMRQRASIARAFAVDPDVLLMDEPFSGLDEFTGRSMREQLLELWRETRKTVIFVTHHCFEACYLADRILVLGRRPGRVVEDMVVPIARPRDYDSTALFELSVEVTRLVTSSAAGAEDQTMEVEG
jgi:NitT/TauT family transport system ATP-binding protein